MIYVKSSYRSFSLLSSQNTILNLQSKMNRMIFFREIYGCMANIVVETEITFLCNFQSL